MTGSSGDDVRQSGPGAYLDAEFAVQRRDFAVQVGLRVRRGDIVALLGENGAGKSTVLQTIAGLLTPDWAEITLGGRRLAGRAGGAPVPASRRRIVVLGQQPLLFPHLSVLQNVAFGLRAGGTRSAAAARLALDWLERIGLAGRAADRPDELSGGQAHRVALARALAVEPQLLLLDEPLAASDVRTAADLRQLLRTHLRDTGTTAIVVSHDVLDAAVLADTTMVMQRGRIVDAGPTSRLLTEPGTAFGAALAGLNMLVGTATGPDSLTTANGVPVSGLAERELTAGPAAAVFEPSAVAVSLDAAGRRPAASVRNSWPGTIVGIEPGPSAVRLRVKLSASSRAPDGAAVPGGAPEAGPDTQPGDQVAVDVTAAAVAALPLLVGTAVRLEVKATQVRVFPRGPAG